MNKMNCCFLSTREAPLKAKLSQLPVNFSALPEARFQGYRIRDYRGFAARECMAYLPGLAILG